MQKYEPLSKVRSWISSKRGTIEEQISWLRKNKEKLQEIEKELAAKKKGSPKK